MKDKDLTNKFKFYQNIRLWPKNDKVRGKEISKWQEPINWKNVKTRALEEHIFGYMEENMHGMRSCVVGFLRNTTHNIFTYLVYNMLNYVQTRRLRMD